MTSTPPRLSMTSVNKSFGPVRALSDVDLKVGANEVHGLLGGNGAGKTTLMNVLYGLYRADSGNIEIDGTSMTITSPRDALAAGVGMVHQTFLQIDTYSVVENVVLGSDDVGGVWSLDLAPARERVIELSERFGLSVDPDAIVENLPVGVRQRVEILKALYRGSKILILDEPTTNLTPQEVDALFESIRTMVDEGMSVILITHKIRETMSVCDRMTVMRNGLHVATVNKTETDAEQLAAIMVGDAGETEDTDLGAVIGADDATDDIGGPAVSSGTSPGVSPAATQISSTETSNDHQDQGVSASDLVIANDFAVHLFNGFDLHIDAGQILGVAGVAGNGQVELAEAMAGVRPLISGSVRLHGTELAGRSTADWLKSGVAYVPEDRHRDGILTTSSIIENLLLGSQRDRDVKRGGLIDWRAARRRAEDAIGRFSVRASGPQALAGELSGGNIQRVILARAFGHNPKLLVLHNPTRGLDLGSTQFVYEQVRAATNMGCAVLLLSEDLDEVITLSDQIIALYAGTQTGAWTREDADVYEIGRSMTGLVQS